MPAIEVRELEDQSPWRDENSKTAGASPRTSAEVADLVSRLGTVVLEAYLRGSQEHEDYEITKHHATLKTPCDPDGEVLQAEVQVLKIEQSEDNRDFVILRIDLIKSNDGRIAITVESEIVLESSTLGGGSSFPLHLYGIGDSNGIRPL